MRTRTMRHDGRHTRQARPAPVTRDVVTDGISPELLAYSQLLREKISQTMNFPHLAKRLGYSGTTHVVIAFSRTMPARVLTISQSSGYDILDTAAVATINKALPTVKPPDSIDHAQLTIPIVFNLKK